MSQRSESNSERINRLYKEYGLIKEDYFRSPQGYTIITRSGVNKIESKLGDKLSLSFEIVHVTNDLQYVVVKACAMYESRRFETYGEVNPLNYKAKKTKAGKELPTYPVAMAEKRARARAVLNLAGFYELNAKSEDESEEFIPDVVDLDVLRKDTPEWESVLLDLKSGAMTINQFKQHYVIPETLEYELMELLERTNV